jgi:hypothetical protein
MRIRKVINKTYIVNRILPITIIFSSLTFLAGCQEVNSRQTRTPTFISETQAEMTNTPEQAEIKNELIPTSDNYTVLGIPPGEFLPILEDHYLDSNPLAYIPSFGSNIMPKSNILEIEDMFWLQVQYQDFRGWIDYSFLAEQQGQIPDDLIDLGQKILIMLKHYQYNHLQELIHPELCLRFSPYPYLNTSNLIFCGTDLDNFTSSNDTLLWGRFDGTGDPISLTFQDYHERFIYDQDYLHSPVVGFNVEVSSGNSINNIDEVYVDFLTIEYHFPSIDPQYGGMDWRSIRLVFVEEGDSWYLVAIIHGEWTI